MVRNLDNQGIGIVILRFAVGGLMLFHGWEKLSGGIDYIFDMLGAAGLPAFIAYGVYLGEVVAPLLILAGWKTSVAAAVYALTMVFSIYLAFPGRILSLTPYGSLNIELNLLFMLGALALVFTGGGKYSVDNYFERRKLFTDQYK